MYLITGGAGFIGSNIAAQMEQQGLGPIAIVDRLRDGQKWRNIAKRELYDVIAPETLSEFLDMCQNKIEAIIHMGAISSTTEANADLIYKNNFQFSIFLWDWCTAHQVPFIYASSAATYGDGSNGFVDDASIEYLKKLRPLNMYGWSKHQFDLRLARVVKDEGVKPPQWVGLKFFNVYGPNEYHKDEMASVIAKAYPMAKEGTPFKLFKSHKEGYSDGGQLRDFVWVGDCVDIVLWFLKNRSNSGLFNCGSGMARSFLDVINAVYKSVKRDSNIKFIDTPDNIRANYQYFTQASLTNLRDAGYSQPMTNIENGIQHYISYYLDKNDRFC